MMKFSLKKHIHFETIDSTNTWAKVHFDQWNDKGVTLVTAATQTAGRGRFKRRWESPPNVNIYATFCFWLPLEQTDIGHIPQLLALAAAKVLEAHHFHPKIKWPNDVLLANKKIAGILCETILEEKGRGVICGIGLNVNMPETLLVQIDRPATSLLVESGQLHEPQILLHALQKAFIQNLNHYLLKGFDPFFSLFKEKSYLQRGQQIKFHHHQTLLNATFEHLNADGSVELRLQDGTFQLFYAGEFLD